jgi:hypothetical protein
VATTAFVQAQKIDPVFTGLPQAPTADITISNTQIATTRFVTNWTNALPSMSQQNANAVNITGGSITGITPLPVSSGGTGGGTQASGRIGLGLGTISVQDANNVAITGGSIYNIVPIAVVDGGTGANNPTTARTNLGLGTISTQSAASVAITGGTITGITPLAVADGGTGGATQSQARTNLGLGTISTQNANSVAITGGAISGITPLPVLSGGTGAGTASAARLNLGLGSISTQDASAVLIGGGSINNVNIVNASMQAAIVTTANAQITGGTITGITPLAITAGGTGAGDYANALTNLGAVGITRQVIAGGGLSGGGALSANITLAIASTSNGYGNRTISTNLPSGGSNGDIWYQVYTL